MSIYTIGHSTLTSEEFLAALGPAKHVVDIRSHPGSSKYPHFNQEALKQRLPDAGIAYSWQPDLGGWSERYQRPNDWLKARGVDVEAYARSYFPKQRIAAKRDDQREPAWTNQGLYDYSFFMAMTHFLKAADHLMAKGKVEHLALACAELVPWRCHRSMVADYLVWNGVEVFHLQPRLTSHSKVLGNRIERYDPEIIDVWKDWAST
jgi:uncharacterized protein (DUF488 family)